MVQAATLTEVSLIGFGSKEYGWVEEDRPWQSVDIDKIADQYFDKPLSVPFGRVDGNRAPIAGKGAHMLVDGVKAPILGVSLEHAVLDLSALPRPAVGREVVVLGRSGQSMITVADIAR